jgi:hypothetical protein
MRKVESGHMDMLIVKEEREFQIGFKFRLVVLVFLNICINMNDTYVYPIMVM